MKTRPFTIFGIFILTIQVSISAELVDFGALTKPVDPELAESLNLAENQGAQIVEVYEITPAAALKLRSGDIVTRINNKPVYHATQLSLLVASYFQKDEEIELIWYRDGTEKTALVTLNRTISEADRKLKYNPPANRHSPPHDPFADRLGLSGLLRSNSQVSPSMEIVRGGVRFVYNLPDGKVTITQSSSQPSLRMVKITSYSGHTIFNEPISAEQIDTKIPEKFQRSVRKAFGTNSWQPKEELTTQEGK